MKAVKLFKLISGTQDDGGSVEIVKNRACTGAQDNGGTVEIVKIARPLLNACVTFFTCMYLPS